MKEIWKDCKANKNYQVSNFGRVRSQESKDTIGRIIKAKILNYKNINSRGYCIIRFQLGGKKSNHTVHRLVADAFLANPQELPQINHKDGDKTNNHINNLEWCNNSYNQKHAVDCGMTKTTLTKKQVEAIRYLYFNGDVTQAELAEDFGVVQQQISRIIRKERWNRE